VRFGCSLIDLSPLRLVPVYARSLAATGAAILPLAIAAAVLPDYRHCGLAMLLVLAMAGGLWWLAALWIVRHPLREEILRMAAPVLPSRLRIA
jgi:hypothetical protein